jgi:hypothetical protein
MNIRRKQLVFQCGYLLPAVATTEFMLLRHSKSDPVLFVCGWIALFSLFGLFYLRCPYCTGPIRYLFVPLLMSYRCARCGTALTGGIDETSSQDLWDSIPQNFRPAKIQIIGLPISLVLFNVFLIASLDGLISTVSSKRTAGILGLALILGANAAFVYGARKRQKTQPLGK